jgi:1,4-dihydroxy-2-naphthoyl-CoA hydrolase
MSFEREVHLGLSSVDRAGVIFYPELFRHAHDLYEAFMATLGQALDQLFDQAGHAIPIVHAEADYRLPMRHRQSFVVTLRVQRLGKTSFALSYDFVGAGGELCAQVQTVHAFIERASGTPTRLPPELRLGLEGFP